MTTRSLAWLLVLLPAVVSFSPRAALREVEAANAGLVLRHGVLIWFGVPFTGAVVDRDSTGSLVRSMTEYHAGLRDGSAQAWYANGQLAYERTYRRGKEEGEHRGWWPDGTPHFVYHYRDGLTEGTAREWFPSGLLYREFHYRAGQEEGSEQMWYADGKLRANYVVKHGRRFGLPGVKGCDGRDSGRGARDRGKSP